MNIFLVVVVFDKDNYSNIILHWNTKLETNRH